LTAINAKASMKNGVLKITMPKPAVPRRNASIRREARARGEVLLIS
jgi:HSP20 family molecular chaperone IbpA